MTQHAEHPLDRLIRHAAVPEMRLPPTHRPLADDQVFFLTVICVAALGSIPFLIAWAASGLLQ